MRYAVIDTGYNSTRLCIYDLFPNQTFRILGSQKLFLRLGEGVKEGSPISPDRVNEAEKVFKSFRAILNKMGIRDVKLVGTSAFRYASNGNQVAELLSEIIGVKMRVLTGEEEGEMSAVGVLNTLPVDSGAMFDLGGGSLEVVYFDSRQVKEVYHFDLGALKLARELKDESELRKRIRSELSVLKPIKGVLVGSGGNIRAIAKMDARVSAFPLKSIHGYVIKTKQIGKYSKVLMNLDPEERENLPGISKERSYTVHTASVVIEELGNALDSPTIMISSFGLREGVLMERVFDNPRERWLESIAYWFNVDPPWELYNYFSDQYMKVASYISGIMRMTGFLDPYEMCHKFTKYAVVPGFTASEMVMVSLLCKASTGELKKKSLGSLKSVTNKSEVLKKGKEIRRVVESSVAGVL
ncbi:exopolyphosphatase [Sulfolobus acidocaldarius SUSAZ]|nr:exopolyphosphatase [Sulfolobus acidocaldarius SUSAZ]